MIKCPLNYVGGKTKLLPQILPFFPENIKTFVDLFGGGFNVGVNVNAEKHLYNELSYQVKDLIKLFYDNTFEEIDDNIIRLEQEYKFKNITYEKMTDEEKEYKKNQYMKLRADYNNNDKDNYKLFLIICNAFSNQIRFNRNGEYNMPVGKRYYNSSIKQNLMEFCSEIKKHNCIFYSMDFRKFLEENTFDTNDFIYADPPYLISNASYNEKASGGWSIQDENDLLKCLDNLNDNNVKWALSNVLENNGYSNDILKEWSEKYNVHHLNYTYGNCNYHRANKANDSDEVLITNF